MTGSVETHETLGAAAAQMIAEDLSCLVAVESGLPRGLVTERELVCGVLCDRLDRAERLDAVPWRPMVAAAEDAPASDAVWIMESYALRHVPVADERGSIIGMLAFEDALALVLEEITVLAARARTAGVRSSPASRRRPILEARDVQTSVSCLDASAPARSVAERISATGAGMLVVRDGARSIGIVSERDLLRTLVAGSTDAESARARDLVSDALVSVAPDEPLDAILARMADHGIRAVGVAGPEDGSIGVVSLANLLASLTVEIAARIELASRPG